MEQVFLRMPWLAYVLRLHYTGVLTLEIPLYFGYVWLIVLNVALAPTLSLSVTPS